MYLSDSEKKLTAEDLKSFNEFFSHHLPASFQDFYTKNNGGYPLNNQEGNAFMLGGFKPIRYGDLPIEKLYRDLIELFGELKNMVPFAYDEGGILFFYRLSLMIHSGKYSFF